jgi:hypothetical protein
MLHPANGARGAAGREGVRQHFLLTCLLADDLRLYRSRWSGPSIQLGHRT